MAAKVGGREYEIERSKREIEKSVSLVTRRKTELTDEQIERLAEAIDQEIIRRERKAARS